MQQPIVVLGGSGMVARAFTERLSLGAVEHRVVGRPDFDLADFGSIARVIPPGTRTVINCAAWTNVDGAETHEAEATRVNGEAVGELASHCKAIGACLVHYSSDYVFSGRASEPYKVDHPRAPLNAYGRSKALGETLLEQAGAEFLLLRTSWVYAPWGKNFVRTILKLAAQRPELKVVDDQLGRPSSAEQIARVTLALLGHEARGIYHVSDGGQCTWFELAREAIARRGIDCRVAPCSSAEFPSPALRPSYSVLDLSKTEALVGPLVPWRTSLADVVQRLGAE